MRLSLSVARRALSDLRGCGGASLAIGISTRSATLASLVKLSQAAHLELLQDIPSIYISLF
jgi:hypothetical protein